MLQMLWNLMEIYGIEWNMVHQCFTKFVVKVQLVEIIYKHYLIFRLVFLTLCLHINFSLMLPEATLSS